MNRWSARGFCPLTERRCRRSSSTARLARCDLVVTGRCSFPCPYGRSNEELHLPTAQANEVIRLWARRRLFALLFTGGEPALRPELMQLVEYAKKLRIPRVGVAANGAVRPRSCHLAAGRGHPPGGGRSPAGQRRPRDRPDQPRSLRRGGSIRPESGSPRRGREPPGAVLPTPAGHGAGAGGGSSAIARRRTRSAEATVPTAL